MSQSYFDELYRERLKRMSRDSVFSSFMPGGFADGGFTSSDEPCYEWKRAERTVEKSPEEQALIGGFMSAMSAEGWQLSLRRAAGYFVYIWRRGSANHQGHVAEESAAAGKDVLARACADLAKMESLTAWIRGLREVFPSLK